MDEKRLQALLKLRAATSNTSSALDEMRAMGKFALEAYPGARGVQAVATFMEELRSSGAFADKNEPYEVAFEMALATEWAFLGCPRFVVSDSVAALLSLTRAPAYKLLELPYTALVIEVSSFYLPVPGVEAGKPVWIALSRLPGEPDPVCLTSLFTEDGRCILRRYQKPDECIDEAEDLASRDLSDDLKHVGRLMARLASNVLVFATEYRQCVTPRSRAKNTRNELVVDVRAPKDVVIDRDLRRYARELAAARSIVSVRKVLQHWVSGHWREQPCGPARAERKRIFIQPFRRGDLSLGKVVERVLHVKDRDVTGS